ncbi:hypothetical protein J4466_00975 [Candidatus Pacearchaeota archaeon]|nr:hypothetical protein [Candidatus Pacearchaeota archaeon]
MGIVTEFPLTNDGDVRIFQRDEATGKDVRRFIAHYEFRSDLFTHTLLYFLQTRNPVPYQNDWNKEWYKGGFEYDELEIPNNVLNSILRNHEKGKLLRLMHDGRKFDCTLERKSWIRNQIFGKLVVPKIDSKGNLIYIDAQTLTDLGEPSITLDLTGVNAMHKALLCHMLNNCRGQRDEPGNIYSTFPFQAYSINQ